MFLIEVELAYFTPFLSPPSNPSHSPPHFEADSLFMIFF